MRKPWGILVLVALIAAGTAGAAYWWRVGRFIESTDDAFVQADISAISPKVEGYVREVHVTDNQQVKAGDVLVVIDDRDFTARADQARGSRDAAHAALAMLETRRNWQKAVIEQAAAAVASAEAELHRSQLELTRQRNLSKMDVASRQKFESAEADAEKADAGMNRARAALAAERDQLAVLDAERVQDQAKVKQAEAALQLAKNDLDDTVIRAPIDGVVGNKGVEIGQLVKPGTLLLALVPLPNVYVVANFKETQLAGIRPGQPVSVTVDALPGKTLRGYVESFAPASGALFSLLPPENATGNFTKIVQRVPVRIALAPDERLRDALRPGLSAVVEVDTRAPAALAAAEAAAAAQR
ncbi:MAG TPA: HlyD family secretion protein [Xanthobacteraceae bacterium]|nr:HlyD family secretion protein [Xanthobacteraceae bacterium]